MTTQEFEQEIKKLDERFSILPNPNRQGLSNIFFMGQNFDLPVVSSFEIKDEPDASYRYEFPNGMSTRLWAKSEIVPRLEQFLESYKSGKLREDYA